MSAQDVLIVTLPSAASLAAPGEHVHHRSHWWHVLDGQVIASGNTLDDLHAATGDSTNGQTILVALAPVADVTLQGANFPGLTARQADAAARLLAAEKSITPAVDLHMATSQTTSFSANSHLIAITSNSLMSRWRDWLASYGLVADHVVPAALLLPSPPVDQPGSFVRATLGDQPILRSDDTAFVADPALVSQLVEDSARIIDTPADTIERAMQDLSEAIPLDLLCGKWAKAPPALIDALTLRRAVLLFGLILLASIAIPLAMLGRLKWDTAALDRRATAQAANVLNEPPPPAQAIPKLDERLANLGGGTARFSATYAALVAAMEPAPTVALTNLAWSRDGTLSATLAAPRTEDINTVLLALQAAGYTITATPRSGTDGRTMGDITIRSVR